MKFLEIEKEKTQNPNRKMGNEHKHIGHGGKCKWYLRIRRDKLTENKRKAN